MLNKENSNLKKTYIAPQVEFCCVLRGQSLLSTMSVYGDVNDYEEGGAYEGTVVPDRQP